MRTPTTGQALIDDEPLGSWGPTRQVTMLGKRMHSSPGQPRRAEDLNPGERLEHSGTDFQYEFNWQDDDDNPIHIIKVNGPLAPKRGKLDGLPRLDGDVAVFVHHFDWQDAEGWVPAPDTGKAMEKLLKRIEERAQQVREVHGMKARVENVKPIGAQSSGSDRIGRLAARASKLLEDVARLNSLGADESLGQRLSVRLAETEREFALAQEELDKVRATLDLTGIALSDLYVP